MTITSKSRAHKRLSQNHLAQAVKELEPKWKKFANGLEPYEWAWEFLRRWPEFQKDSDKLEGMWKNWHPRSESEFWDTPEAQKMVDKYGLMLWVPPKEDMRTAGWWGENSYKKYWSQAKVWRKGNKYLGKVTIDLDDNEALLVVNYDVPYQAYIEEIKKIYQKKGLAKPLPSIQVSKFPVYLQIYDLRQWGITKGLSKKDKSGKIVSSPTWEEIAEYLYPNPKRRKTVQGLKKSYAATEKLIKGDYKKILRYKG